MERVFNAMKTALPKQELRHLMQKLRVSDEKIIEVEQKYNTKALLQDRVYHSLK